MTNTLKLMWLAQNSQCVYRKASTLIETRVVRQVALGLYRYHRPISWSRLVQKLEHGDYGGNSRM